MVSMAREESYQRLARTKTGTDLKRQKTMATAVSPLAVALPDLPPLAGVRL